MFMLGKAEAKADNRHKARRPKNTKAVLYQSQQAWRLNVAAGSYIIFSNAFSSLNCGYSLLTLSANIVKDQHFYNI